MGLAIYFRLLQFELGIAGAPLSAGQQYLVCRRAAWRGEAVPNQQCPQPRLPSPRCFPAASTHCLQAAHKAWGYPFDYINPKAFPQASV